MRIGIGPPPTGWDVADYVLSRFKEEERKEIDALISTAVTALPDWVEQGVDYYMNRYNSS